MTASFKFRPPYRSESISKRQDQCDLSQFHNFEEGQKNILLHRTLQTNYSNKTCHLQEHLHKTAKGLNQTKQQQKTHQKKKKKNQTILNYTQNILIFCVEKIALCEYACKYKNSFCKVLTSSIPVYYVGNSTAGTTWGSLCNSQVLHPGSLSI